VGAGVATGLLAGLFGVGGGAVIVPVLFEVFRILDVPDALRMQLCVGTSLAIIVPTTVRSYRAHRAKGLVIPGVLRSCALPAVAGVAVGSVAAAFAPAGMFKLAFVLIAGTIAARLLVGREDWVLAHQLPGRRALSAWGFLVGLASSLMGISGGSLATMVLTLYGKPIHNAVATSAGLGVPITIAGTLGYMRAATSSHVAAAVDRLCINHRGRNGCADLELGRAVRRAARACSAPAPPRDRVWIVSADRLNALCRELDHAVGELSG